MAHHGNLYQLQVAHPVRVGSIVYIDGPYDTWGRVIAVRESGYHLIRGVDRQTVALAQGIPLAQQERKAP